jgi:hypothetical protein
MPAVLKGRNARLLRFAAMGSATALLLAVGPMANAPGPLASPAEGQPTTTELPKPPADGVMGFLVDRFVQPVIQGPDACPNGTSPKLREMYLRSLPADEQARLRLKENAQELDKLWQRTAFGPGGANLCSQPDMFLGKRPLALTVQSKNSWGLNLDGKENAGDSADGCAHEDFTTPTGVQGIDNQEYRVMGCQLEWRGVDGVTADQAVGMRQFMASGEWTQVILLRGVDSLQNDNSVEVIYANTPDRPPSDQKGEFLRGASFIISDKAPRERNVLHGRIVNGVLTTDPADIKLVQTWGQGGARDIRGNRSKYEYRKGRLQLAFQPDGSLRGYMGGYRPLFDVIISAALGGAGSNLVAGIDCSSELATLQKYADGLKNPKTGKCEGISAAQEIRAIPAFVTDITAGQRTAAR